MEVIVVNLVGKVRYDKLDGRDYLIAHMTMIVPGVLNGSKGPLYYPLDEVEKDPQSWNYMPIVASQHPRDRNGKHVSARSPSVINAQGIGFVFEANARGKLTGEGWFDIEKTTKVDRRIIDNLKAGLPIELSTGLGTENDWTPGVFNDVPYMGIARNYRPDHLAVFIDKEGACSLRDGCGVLANEEQKGIFAKFSEWMTQGSQFLALAGISDKGITITNEKKEPPMAAGKLSDADKKLVLDNLIGNCGCAGKPIYTENDRTALAGLSDEVLTRMDEQRKATVANEKVSGALKKGFVLGDQQITFNEELGVFTAAKVPPKADDGLVDNVDIATLQPGDTFEAVVVGNVRKYKITKKVTPVTNQPTAPAAPQTDADWFKNAPASVRSVVQNAVRVEAGEKNRLIAAILANERNQYTQEQLANVPLESDLEKGITGLRALGTMLGNTQHAQEANWLGAAAPVYNVGQNFRSEDSDMVTPTMNFEEAKADALRKAS